MRTNKVRPFHAVLWTILLLCLLCGCAGEKKTEAVEPVSTSEATRADTTTALQDTTTSTTSQPMVTLTTTTVRECTLPTVWPFQDSDGEDPYKKGTVLTSYGNTVRNESCVNATAVLEYTCEVVDCNILLRNRTIDCPQGYSCADGACVNESASEAPAKTPRYGSVTADLSMNKPLYHSGESMTITVKVSSQKRIDVNVNLYGIHANYYRLNQTRAVVLDPGANYMTFNYDSPPCNRCAGVAEGSYVISAEVLYNDNVIARDKKSVELRQ